MKLFETSTCAKLPTVDHDMVEAIKNAERNPTAHRAFMRAIEAMHQIELGGEQAMSPTLGNDVTVAAWNLQRCLYPEQSAELLRQHAPDVILVSEMDNGMARTHQRNTVRALANCLEMRYAFGVEFFELGLGNEVEVRLAADPFNERGWHGNAVLSRVEPLDVALIRLDDHGQWFCPDRPKYAERIAQQPRIGGRCAIAAIFPTTLGNICTVSTHLENNAPKELRLSQMERLIAALDCFAPDLPTIIGGDMNGDMLREGHETQKEPLFSAATRHGFSWRNNVEGPTTRPSPLSGSNKPKLHLDWLCARGFLARGAKTIAALDEAGKVLSDHDMILGHFEQE